MKILFVASEAYPLVKTGGLGDVLYSLPHALHHRGADIRLVLPGYRALLRQLDQVRILGWLDVRWDVDENSRERFPTRIEVTAINEPGTLAQIAQIIADSDGNISNLRILTSASDFSVMLIDIEVWDLKHLTRLIGQLRSRPVVNAVTRA